MTRQEMEGIMAQRLDAWQRHDAAALAASHSEDGVYESMLMGTIRKRGEIESLYRDWFSAFPEMEFEIENQIIDGDQVAIFWSQRGRHMGEFCGLAATGRVFQVRGAFFHAFQDGMIVRTRCAYDITGLLVQIGVLQAKPGF